MEGPMITMGGEASESITAVSTAGTGYRVLGEPSYAHLVDVFDPNLGNGFCPFDPPYLPSYPISPVLSDSFTVNRSSGTDYPSFGPCDSHLPLVPPRPPFPLTGPEILPFSVKPPPLPPLQLLKNRQLALLNAPSQVQDDKVYRGWSGSPVPKICLICNREGKHILQHCPFMVLATLLDVFKANPSNSIIYKYYFARYRDRGIHGMGKGRYIPPVEGDSIWAAVEAMHLLIQGIHVVRVTNVQTDNPEELYKMVAKIGVVTHVLLFLDQHLGFVGFVDKHDAEEAISQLNSSGCGLLEWATVSR